MSNYFWNIEYNKWEKYVSAFLSTNNNILDKYLQLYPFSKFSDSLKTRLKSEDFFNSYICNCAFLNDRELKLYKTIMTKKSGGFREVTVSSPIIFLVLNVIGGHLFNKVNKLKIADERISTFYSGNYEKNIFHYRSSYKSFSKMINEKKDEYKFCFKTDISKFYSSIDVNLLIDNIRTMCDEDENPLLFYKNLFLYLGNGKFPTITNSTGLSYISTEIYLDSFDKSIVNNLSEIEPIEKFNLVRYVDDLYVFFNCQEKNKNKCEQNIKQIIQDAAFQKHLFINTDKQKSIINADMLSINDVSTYENDYHINFNAISNELNDKLNMEKLTILLDSLISLEGFPSRENVESTIKKVLLTDSQLNYENFNYIDVLNFLIYDKSELFKSEKIINKLEQLISNLDIIQYYPEIFVTMILNTKNGCLIRKFLNYLFEKYRENPFSKYYEVMALTYLIRRNFHHSELIDSVGSVNNDIKKYIENYCKIETKDPSKFIATSYEFEKEMYSDDILNYLRLMKLYMHNNKNYIEEFGYHKVYFDRKLSYLCAELKIDGATKKSKVTFKFTYKQKSIGIINKALKENNININDDLINDVKESYSLRNNNPIVHSSAGIITSNKKTDVSKIMESLDKFLIELSEQVWK